MSLCSKFMRGSFHTLGEIEVRTYSVHFMRVWSSVYCYIVERIALILISKIIIIIIII